MRLQAEAFESAQQFLDAFDRASLVACCLDVRMPGISGLGLLDEFNREDIHLPAIVMSAYGDVPMVVRAMKAGALNFLEKPCRDQQLWEAIQEAIKWDAANRGRLSHRAKARHRLEHLSSGERDVLRVARRRQAEQGHRRRVEPERADDRSPPGQAHEEDEGRVAG